MNGNNEDKVSFEMKIILITVGQQTTVAAILFGKLSEVITHKTRINKEEVYISDDYQSGIVESINKSKFTTNSLRVLPFKC